MMPDILIEHPWLWTLIWQSTVCLGAGLSLSLWLHQRPVRAHQVLLLALMAAMLMPMLSCFVAQHEWGWFVERVLIADSPEQAPLSVTPQTALPPVSQPGEPSSAAISTAPAAPRGIRLEFVFVSIWIAVSLLLLIRLIIRFALGYCLVTRSTSVAENVLRDTTEQAKALLSLKTSVACHATPSISSPVVWCWSKKPMLLIPEMWI
jgi:beta-lactamase regulating signal transducer with metallopeptidase domain